MFQRCVSRLGAGIFGFAAFTMLLVVPQGLMAQDISLQDSGDPTLKASPAKPALFEELVVPEPEVSQVGLERVIPEKNAEETDARTFFTSVTGFVYRDFNSNGVKDTYDIGVPGVLVSAYGSNGTLITSTTTNASGSYSLSIATGVQARVEFTQIPTGAFPTNAGTSNGTTVQFVTSPASNVNLGINYPADYCEDNPKMAAPSHRNGDPLAGGNVGPLGVLFSFNYNDTNGTPLPTQIATAAQVGATYGVAYQRETKKLFVSAFTKRHAGFGPLGTGGIYQLDMSIGTPTVSNYLNLATLGINTGANPHTGLPADKFAANADLGAFDAVGKTSLGDMDISDDRD